VRIALRRLHLRVAKNLLHLIERASGVHQERRERVAQVMDDVGSACDLGLCGDLGAGD
jgi:hypothetical protein